MNQKLQMGWRAYIPPAWLGGQGLSLVLFLNSSLNLRLFSEEGVALGLFIFAAYLLESTGFLSPEDRVNQPSRFLYFQSRGRTAFLVAGLAILVGLLVLGSKILLGRVMIAAVVTSGLLFSYSVLRWKEYGLLKPLIISLAWLVAVCGFLSSGLWPSPWLLTGLFILLFLDSLWLDVRDRAGDRLYGIRIRLISERPYMTLFSLHLLFALGLILLPFEFSRWLQISNVFLLFCGFGGRLPISRWTYGLMIPLWSYLLAISTFVGS